MQKCIRELFTLDPAGNHRSETTSSDTVRHPEKDPATIKTCMRRRDIVFSLVAFRREIGIL